MSALVHRARWANDLKHTQAQVWLEAGWRVRHVSQVNLVVDFERTG